MISRSFLQAYFSKFGVVVGSLLALVLIVIATGCATEPIPPIDNFSDNDSEQQEVTFEERVMQNGSFITRTLEVKPDLLRYSVVHSNGTVILDLTEEISPEWYRDFLTIFQENNFQNLQSNYSLPPGPSINATTGVATITLRDETGNPIKTVAIDPYVPSSLPQEVRIVTEGIENTIASALTEAFAQIEATAREWIEQESLTHGLDGYGLILQDHSLLLPGQRHSLVYAFNSTYPGYGERNPSGGNTSNITTNPAPTPHVIQLIVEGGSVVEAIIDGTWDELNQERLRPTILSFTYQPIQCEEMPWEAFFGADDNTSSGENMTNTSADDESQEELIAAYYNALHGIALTQIKILEVENSSVCQACGCPTTFIVEASGDEADAETLLALGWERS